MPTMKIRQNTLQTEAPADSPRASRSDASGLNGQMGSGDAPGIIIADGGVGSRLSGQHPRVRAFVYGERIPATPTLPFGRWKVAS